MHREQVSNSAYFEMHPEESLMSEVVSLVAPDISCAHCEATVRKAVGDLPGVVNVDVSSATKVIKVTVEAGKSSVPAIQAALDDAGYPAQVQ